MCPNPYYPKNVYETHVAYSLLIINRWKLFNSYKLAFPRNVTSITPLIVACKFSGLSEVTTDWPRRKKFSVSKFLTRTKYQKDQKGHRDRFQEIIKVRKWWMLGPSVYSIPIANIMSIEFIEIRTTHFVTPMWWRTVSLTIGSAYSDSSNGTSIYPEYPFLDKLVEWKNRAKPYDIVLDGQSVSS